MVRVCPWRVRDDDHSCGLLVAWRCRRAWVVMLGWGWDGEMPLRPWPALALTPTPGGARGICVAWCGVFVQVRRAA